MLFELSNGAANRVSHCGVLEFIAEEGLIYMPYWRETLFGLRMSLFQKGNMLNCNLTPKTSWTSPIQKPYEDTLAEPEPTGVRRRLDGRPGNPDTSSVSPSVSSGKQPAVLLPRGEQSTVTSSSQTANRQSQGKLVFCSSANHAPKEAQKEPAKESKQQEPEKEQPKFQPFSGKKYSLRG